MLMGKAPVYKTAAVGELITPTGAALLSEFVSHFGASPVFEIEAVGQGFGTAHRPELPNIVRLMLGHRGSFPAKTANIIEMVTTVDDVSGVVLGHAAEKLRSAGALDVYLVSTQMKKGRPGFEVHVLCRPEDSARFFRMIFSETGTLGIRIYPVQRVVLPRWLSKAKKDGFEMDEKIVQGIDGHFQRRPEYESLKKIAEAERVPLRHIHNGAH